MSKLLGLGTVLQYTKVCCKLAGLVGLVVSQYNRVYCGRGGRQDIVLQELYCKRFG